MAVPTKNGTPQGGRGKAGGAFSPSLKRGASALALGDSEQQGGLVEQRLAQLPPEEIQGFDRLLWQFMQAAYDDHLWAAAYLINGGCSDDGFDYFRGWLIAQGESVFHAALQDPETLADVTESLEQSEALESSEWEYECEGMLSVAWHAYEARTGEEMPQADGPLLDLTKKSPEANDPSRQESPWEDGGLKEDYARKHFPKLWAKFGW